MSDQPEGQKFKPARGGGKPPANDLGDVPEHVDDVDGDLNAFLAFRAQNDLGNAERLRYRFGENLAYVPEMGWMAWDGRRWSVDDGPRCAQIWAQQTSSLVRAEAAAMKAQSKDGSGLQNWARESGSRSRISAMQHEAQPHLTYQLDQFDDKPLLVNVGNGTLELGANLEPHQGSVSVDIVTRRDHRRDDLKTHMADVEFDADAIAPAWESFIHAILPDDNVRLFVQRYFGYALTGLTGEQVLVLMLGTGSNGKSALLNALGGVMGDYEMALPIGSLLHDERRSGSGPSPDIARLPGARFVRASEPEAGSRFSETMIKSLTGGESLTARHLNKPFFEFSPQFKLAIGANTRPSVRGSDDGIWRRLLIVPFEQKVGSNVVGLVLDSNNRPREDIKSAILNWMLDGFRMWFENGLQIPDKVRAATDEYRADSNPIRQFIDDWTVDAKGQTISAGRIFDAYKHWCRENGIEAVSQTKLGRRLVDMGLRKEKIGIIVYMDRELTLDAVDSMDRSAGFGGEGHDGDGGG